MTIDELKSWLEGLSESINNAPTPQQWEKILEKINSLSDWKYGASSCYTLGTFPSNNSEINEYLKIF